jgi:D-sedoheptulose 7-phosphate isomerase
MDIGEAEKTVRTHLEQSTSVKQSLLGNASRITRIAQIMCETVKAGGTIYSCGNGGSACDAMHLTEELVARYKRDRPGIRAQHFLDPGTITCWSNDKMFDDVFARPAKTFLTGKDVLVIFSTSGQSANIIKALEAARQTGAKTIGLLGKGGGAALKLCDEALVVSSDQTAYIQEAHITLVHILCELIETTLFPSAK